MPLEPRLARRLAGQRYRTPIASAEPTHRCARCGLGVQSELEPWVGEMYECKQKQECWARSNYGASEFARDVAEGRLTVEEAPVSDGQFLLRAGRFWNSGLAPLEGSDY